MKITETKLKKNIDALGAILETKGGGTEIDDTNSADRIGEKIG